MDQKRDNNTAGQSGRNTGDRPHVEHFRQILFWPVHLMAPAQGEHRKSSDRAAAFADLGPDNPWKLVEDEFTGNPDDFQERHYNEFVTFLPPVQRFLYGQGGNDNGKKTATSGKTPIKVMRRCDIAAMRVVLAPGEAPITLQIAHTDLYFFYDTDIAILALEVFADSISLATAQDIMYRVGRAYPGFWETDGVPGHCVQKVEWLSHSGEVLAASDFEERDLYLQHVCKYRTARIGAHWEYLLRPLLPAEQTQAPMRYSQLEYYRMPLMAFLAFDDADKLTPTDYVRLAYAKGSRSDSRQNLTDHHMAEFESRHCYDVRNERRDVSDWPSTRYMSCGHTFVVTGDARNAFFVNGDHGLLNTFRHQFYMLFLIAHFQKAAMMMFSDRLAEAVNRLDISDPKAVLAFRSATRQALETFLRFTHRYWFHVVSNQDQSHDLFALCRDQLEVDRLYEDVRQEVMEMSQYLENEAMRRQNESVARLTVVTAFGLIGTVATGFLGMNLFDHTALSALEKLAIFVIVFIPTLILTFYTIAKSQRLTEFLDALSNQTLGIGEKFKALVRVWWR